MLRFFQLHLWKVGLLAIALMAVSCQPSGSNADALFVQVPDRADHLDFPTPLSSNNPWDVNQTLEKQLMAEGKFAETQRLFEVLSWQAFIGLNWPTNAEGAPQPTLTDSGEPVWFGWKEVFEVYKSDGSAPSPWGESESQADLGREFPKEAKVLFRTSKFSEFQHSDVVNEIDQAFTAAIWDQNGNPVRYEVRMNEAEFDYVVANELYNFDGQIAFHKTGNTVAFPEGDVETPGAVEIKIAWKVMTPEDKAERYYTTKAFVFNEDSTYTEETVGMIGMHISLKTKSSPQWIWSTFEHVDNLETNALDGIKPSFNDPDCATCPINLFPDTMGQEVVKNQIQRVIPIPQATQELNQQVQGILSGAGSVFQYYQLIGAQWPTDPSSPPFPYDGELKLPEAVTNKSGGKPTPAYLTNMIMETYFQGSTLDPNTLAAIKKAENGNSDVFNLFVGNGTNPVPITQRSYNEPQNAFNVLIGNQPAYSQIQGFPRDKDVAVSRSMIFGTESCMGCHFSGAIAIGDTLVDGVRTPQFGKPGSADFSWLIQLKAHFKTDSN